MNLNIRKMIGLFSLLAVLIPSQCLSFLDEDEEVIKSIMSGKIRRVAVVPGQQVKRGDLLYIFEVMKMECAITSLRDGFIGLLNLTVDQYIEKDMPLITIVAFMPIEKEGGPMDTDELPLPTSQDNEPFLKDALREITAPLAEAISNEEGSFDVSSVEMAMTLPVEQSISEDEFQTPQQAEMLPLLDAFITETFDREEKASDISSSKIVITAPVEQSISEDEPQTPQQEEMLPLVIAPIIESFDNEGEGPDISSPTGVIASEAKQSIPDYQPPQRVSTPSCVAADSGPKASTHLPWLTRLLLLAFLSFCRLGGIMPYRIKNILTPKAAENLNVPGYLRNAA